MVPVAQSKKGGVDFKVDFKAVSEFIGEGEAWVALSKDKRYLDMVMNNAFQEANDRLNVQAAAAAASGAANIRHMFEWGTLGINSGRTNRRARPTSESARLWMTTFTGRGSKKDIDFHYKLSTAKVPLPNKSRTGISIAGSKLKQNHVFKWKAKIMESGVSVSISNKGKKKFLVFPSSRGKGFVFVPRAKQPVTTVPGRASAGQFHAFFTDYWNSEGHQIMENRFTEAFEELVVKEMSTNTEGPLVPAGTSIKKDIQSSRDRAKNAAMRRAKGKLQ